MFDTDKNCQGLGNKLAAMKNIFTKKLPHVMLLMAILFSANAASAETFISNKATLDYEIKGNGDPVFIMHGGLASREDLRLLINHLAKSHKIIALDSREHGRSSNSPLQISYELMASDVYNLAQHLGIQSATLIGQSDGGSTALTAAFHYPSFVKRLVLLGTSYNHSVQSKATKEYFQTVKWPANLDMNTFPGMFLDDYFLGGRSMTDYQAWFDELAYMWTTSPNFSIEQLAQLKMPVQIISGDRKEVPLYHTTALYEALPNAQLFVVPNASHFLHTEKPDLLHAAISSFLEH